MKQKVLVLVIMVLLQVGDLFSTRRAFAHSAVELNPVMHPFGLWQAKVTRGRCPGIVGKPSKKATETMDGHGDLWLHRWLEHAARGESSLTSPGLARARSSSRWILT